MGGVASPRAHATCAHYLDPGGPLPFFCFSSCFSCKNINSRKSLDQFEFQKVHETSKYAKQVFPVMLSYNQNKGDRWKIPINKHKTLLWHLITSKYVRICINKLQSSCMNFACITRHCYVHRFSCRSILTNQRLPWNLTVGAHPPRVEILPPLPLCPFMSSTVLSGGRWYMHMSSFFSLRARETLVGLARLVSLARLNYYLFIF
jgi:hypothetical protein